MVIKLSYFIFWIFYKCNIFVYVLVKFIFDCLLCEFFFGYFMIDVVINFVFEIYFSISFIECGLFYRYIFFKMVIFDGLYSVWI